MLPAARQSDIDACPTHGPVPIGPPCCPSVLIENLPVARQGDSGVCPTGPDPILDGSPTVYAGNRRIARLSERCAHGGVLLTGSARVLVGNPPIGADGHVVTIPAECWFLRDFNRTDLKGGTGKILDRLRDHYQLTAPTTVMTQVPVGDEKFRGDWDPVPVPYTRKEITIRGHKIVIYETQGPTPSGKWRPSASSVEDALATLSDEQLSRLDEVYITNILYNKGYADCGGRRIRIYLRDERHPQADVDWLIQHEAGHALAQEQWEKHAGLKAEWQRAMDQDHRRVSAYGETNIDEDFAEFMVMYAITKGTPCEASARALFPSRYRAMEKLFPNGITVRRPRSATKAY